MRRSRVITAVFLIMVGLLTVFGWRLEAQAAATMAPVNGEIEVITIDNPADPWSGGKMVVGGQNVIIPRNLLIDLPANRLTLAQLFLEAPAACLALGESGLAKADTCNTSGVGGFALIAANRTGNGNVIAGDVLIEKGRELVAGIITYIDHTDGYFRLNGNPNDSATGVMVRLNDPPPTPNSLYGRHTVQQGLGCTGPGNNCSPDPRFTLDSDNYTNRFSNGYPVCISSTMARTFTDVLGLGITTAQASPDGTGDVLCPTTNRNQPVDDSRRFAPIMLGDSIAAEGNFETINGVRFLSAHSMTVNGSLTTKGDPGQPDYLFLEEAFVDAPAFNNLRARALFIGFTTLNTDVNLWSRHFNPVDNAVQEFPLASVSGCDTISGGDCGRVGIAGGAGGNIFKIRYDVDFDPTIIAKKPELYPCFVLRNDPDFAPLNICPGGGTTVAENFAILSPTPHEIVAKTRRKTNSLKQGGVPLITLDILGNEATNGEYIFPFGVGLGGISLPEFVEINLDALNTPYSFSGLPWNLDRRLSPDGCDETLGCEGTPQPLDPFPFEGLDPRSQVNLPVGTYSDPNYTASQLNDVRNRILSYVDGVMNSFNGNSTVLAWPPADPAALPITAAAQAIPCALGGGGGVNGPAATVNDSATTLQNVPVTINVIANDTGSINPATVSVGSAPANGSAVSSANGTITYTPNPDFTGTNTFTYTVLDNLGAVSNAATVTVTVTAGIPVNAPPVANSDSATTNQNVAVTIDVVANDTQIAGTINPATVTIRSQPANATAVPDVTGGVLYTPVQGFAGTDSFTYTVKDNLNATSNVATVVITVNPPVANVAPVAGDDTASTVADIAAVIDVVNNDTDSDGFINAASVIIGTAPANGTAVANANGKVVYTPNPGITGADSFTYTVRDNQSAVSNAATVSITIGTANIAPVANPDTASTNSGVAVIINVVNNDTDADGFINPGSVVIASGPANGTAVVNANGTVNYTPAGGFSGQDSFTYTVEDNAGAVSGEATVNIQVSVPETIVVRTARVNNSGRWNILGSSSLRANNSITIHAGDINGPIIGTTNVNARGNWRFRGRSDLGSGVSTIAVLSAYGNVEVVTVPR